MAKYLGATGLDLGGQKITTLADPSASQDAATKNYVDNASRGQDWKASVRAASTATITVSNPGTSTMDGVTLVALDRVLLKNQSTGSENGIYIFNGSASAMTRANDADTSAKVTAGMTMYVEEGTANGDKAFLLTTDNPIVLGTTALTFTQTGGGNSYTAGNGLQLSSNTFSVLPNGTSIDVAAGGIKVSSSAAGNGIAVSGVGLISANIGAGLVNSAGATIVDTGVVARWYSNAATHSAGTTVSLTHNLGRLSYHVSIAINATGEEVLADVIKGTNSVTVTFGASQGANTILLSVAG